MVISLKIGGNTPKNIRNSFDLEFRLEAAKLVVEQKYSIREAGKPQVS